MGRDADGETERARALARWLDDVGSEKVLVFANSRNGAHALAAHLHRRGYRGLTMAEAERLRTGGGLPPRSVVFTFAVSRTLSAGKSSLSRVSK